MVDRGYPSILLYSGRLNYSKIAPAFGSTTGSWYFSNYFIISFLFSERNKVEMTDTLNLRCHARMSRKITLPKKLIFSLNFSTDE